MSRFYPRLFLMLIFAFLAACESAPKLEEDVAPVEERSYHEVAGDSYESSISSTPKARVEERGTAANVTVYGEEEPYMPPLEPLQLARTEPTPDSSLSTTTTQYKTGPAAQGLLNQASTLAKAGKADQAAGLIERALRIEPSNPWLWHRLSVLRLQQNLYKQSIDLARKSISLASGNRRLQAGNWQVIAKASDRIGDSKTAREAKRQAKSLGGS